SRRHPSSATSRFSTLAEISTASPRSCTIESRSYLSRKLALTRSTTNGISNRNDRPEALRAAAGESGAARHRDGRRERARDRHRGIPGAEGRTQHDARGRRAPRSAHEPDSRLRSDGVSAAGRVESARNGRVSPGTARTRAEGPVARDWILGPGFGDPGRQAVHQQRTGKEARRVLPSSGGSVYLSRGADM